MQRITLTRNQITRINSNAFHLTQPSDVPLDIILSHNDLSGDSFGDNAFNVGNRTTMLSLQQNPKLKYLNETVFRPFLANKEVGRNEIRLNGTLLDYYQENLWLLQNKLSLNLVDKISKAKMVDGLDLWDADITKFTMMAGNSPTSNNASSATTSTTRTTTTA